MPYNRSTDKNPKASRVALGAICGAIVAFALDPILGLVPDNRLVHAFLGSILSEATKVATVIILTFLAVRIRRLDRLIERRLPLVAWGLAALLATALWGNAGWPFSLTALLVSIVTALAAMIFIGLCGWVAYDATHQLSEEEEKESERQREKEAQGIAWEAIQEGDPNIASSIFGISAMGAINNGILKGCSYMLLMILSGIMVAAATFMEAYLLYHLSILWSVILVLLLLIATQPILKSSLRIGQEFSNNVPLKDKTKPIIPED